MKRLSKSVPAVLLPAILIFMSLTACDTADISSESEAAVDTEDTVAALAVDLSSELDLNSAEASQVSGVLSKGYNGDPPEPGALWRVAASLNETLTDEQKQRLFDRTEQILENRTGQFFGHRMRHKHRAAGRFLRDILTDEQKEQVKEMREGLKAELDSLKGLVDSGELDEEAAREARHDLLQAHHEEVRALLTEEQIAEIEAAREEKQEERAERREEAKEVMIEVLELSADQQAALEEEFAQHSTAVASLRDQLKEGTIDRETFAEEMETLRDEHWAFLEETLDEYQFDIAQIHRALKVRMAVRHARGGHGNGSFERGEGPGFGPGNGRQGPGGQRGGGAGYPGGRFG